MDKIETNVTKPKVLVMIDEVEHRIVTASVEQELDKKLNEAHSFMTDNTKKGLPEEKQIELYAKAKMLWKEYYDLHLATKYSFFLNREQYSYLDRLIKTNLEYDVNTVFFAIGLRDMLEEMKKSKVFTNDKDVHGFEVDATEITYIYHLISKHKVKGLTKDTYTFSELLIKIGDISKVFNYYETANKNLSTDIHKWVIALQDGVNLEEPQMLEEPKSEGKSKSKKKKEEEKA